MAVKHILQDTYIFKWKVENFSFCALEHEDKLRSPEFSMELLGGTKWQLTLYPRGTTINGKNALSCFLRKCSNNVESVELEFDINVITQGGYCSQSLRISNQKFEGDTGHGYNALKMRKEIFANRSMYLPDDTLTIRCTLHGVGSPNFMQSRLSRIQETFFPHIKNPKLSDVESVALDQELMRKTQCIPVEWEARTVLEVKQMSVEYFGLLSQRYVPIVIADSFPSLMVMMNLETDEKTTVQIKIRELNKRCSSFAKCKLCIMDSNDWIQYESEYEHFFKSSPPFFWKISVNFNELNGGFLSKPVKVKFNFRMSVDDRGHSWIEAIKFKYLYPQNVSPCFSEDMSDMYAKQAFCDFTLVSKDSKKFQAHKVVLGMRSPVFKAMLEHDTKQVRENCVVMRDINGKTLDLLLSYMYSSILPNIDFTEARKLYPVAKKYEIMQLQEHCSKVMQSELNLKTAYDILRFSDRHQDVALKNAVVEFVYRHSSEVLISDTWISLIKTHPKLVAEVLRWVSAKASKKKYV